MTSYFGTSKTLYHEFDAIHLKLTFIASKETGCHIKYSFKAFFFYKKN